MERWNQKLPMIDLLGCSTGWPPVGLHILAFGLGPPLSDDTSHQTNRTYKIWGKKPAAGSVEKPLQMLDHIIRNILFRFIQYPWDDKATSGFCCNWIYNMTLLCHDTCIFKCLGVWSLVQGTLPKTKLATCKGLKHDYSAFLKNAWYSKSLTSRKVLKLSK